MEEIMGLLVKAKEYITPVLVIVVAILGLKNIGYKITTEILTSAIKWIQQLEQDSTIPGPEKMKLIVSYVKNFIPRFFTVVFSDKVIKSIAESVFEDMQKYSENRVERKTGMTWDQMLKVVEESQYNKQQEAGLYTFKDGTTMRYVGEFEKSLLSYMDQHNMVPEVSMETKTSEEGS